MLEFLVRPHPSSWAGSVFSCRGDDGHTSVQGVCVDTINSLSRSSQLNAGVCVSLEARLFPQVFCGLVVTISRPQTVWIREQLRCHTRLDGRCEFGELVNIAQNSVSSSSHIHLCEFQGVLCRRFVPNSPAIADKSEGFPTPSRSAAAEEDEVSSLSLCIFIVLEHFFIFSSFHFHFFIFFILFMCPFFSFFHFFIFFHFFHFSIF